jgi:hypothetical protein
MGKGGKKTTVSSASTGPDAASQAYIDQMRQQAMRASQIATGMPPPGQQQANIPPRLGSQIGVGQQGQPGQDQGFFTGPLTQTPEQMAQPFMDPYQKQVVDATRNEFDQMRGQATVGANQAATQAGAFGGSRHGVMQGTRLGEIDRAQGTTISNLLSGGYQNAMENGVGFAQYQQGLQAQKQMEPLWRQQQGLNFMNLGMGQTGMVSSGTEDVEEKKDWGNAVGPAIGTAATLYGIYNKMQNGQKPGQAPGGAGQMGGAGQPAGATRPGVTYTYDPYGRLGRR